MQAVSGQGRLGRPAGGDVGQSSLAPDEARRPRRLRDPCTEAAQGGGICLHLALVPLPVLRRPDPETGSPIPVR
jgi:hypothetical protein